MLLTFTTERLGVAIKLYTHSWYQSAGAPASLRFLVYLSRLGQMPEW
jgi:hypothetical protein